MAIANERDDLVVVRTDDNLTMERYARAVTVQMGGAALIAEYAMDGATARAASIPARCRSASGSAAACARRAPRTRTRSTR